jgi:hypothetical protein
MKQGFEAEVVAGHDCGSLEGSLNEGYDSPNLTHSFAMDSVEIPLTVLGLVQLLAEDAVSRLMYRKRSTATPRSPQRRHRATGTSMKLCLFDQTGDYP